MCGQQFARHCQTLRTIHSGICGMIMGDLPADVAPWSDPFPKNPVIGAFFREIHRADELGSGMRKMMRYGKAYGGADPEMIEGDVFRIVVKVPEFTPPPADEIGAQEARTGPTRDAATGEVTGEVAGEVTGEVCKLLEVLGKRALTRTEAQAALSLKGQANFRERYLGPALEVGLIEMTIPDKPRSSKQKYRLTQKGQSILSKIRKVSE